MTKLEKFSKRVRKPHELLGPVEADPEYLLIVDANNLAAQIDNELSIIHKVGSSCKYYLCSNIFPS